MSIIVQCPQCGKKYAVPDSAAGQRATCKPCQVHLLIPKQETSAPPSAPDQTASAASVLSVDDTVDVLNQLLSGSVTPPVPSKSAPATVPVTPVKAPPVAPVKAPPVAPTKVAPRAPAKAPPVASPVAPPRPRIPVAAADSDDGNSDDALELTDLDVVQHAPRGTAAHPAARVPAYAPPYSAPMAPVPAAPPSNFPMDALAGSALAGSALGNARPVHSAGGFGGGFSLADRKWPLIWSLGGGLGLALMVALVANFIGGVIVPPNINQVVEQQPLDVKGFIDSAVMARLPRPPADNIVPGVERINVVLPHGRLIVYLPSGAQPASLGCVFIAPAGTTGLHGLDLGDGDSPEHLPYVQAGFAVCAYSLDGHLDNDTAGDAARFAAFQQFRQSNAGLNNAADAINYVLSHIPEVSPNRLYTAGHSSAGGTALLLAAHEPRIKGCIAYAAASDFLGDAKSMFVFNIADKFMPGTLAFIERTNPRGHESRIKCPLFLFHALDDTLVEPRFSREMAERFKQAGKKVELVTVPSGDHHESMIQSGIPRAIAWLQQIDRARGGGQVPAPSGSSGVTPPSFPPMPPMVTQPPVPAKPEAGDGFTAPLSE